LVTGRTVLDFAAGGGIAAIAAVIAGARRVLASDTDPFCAVVGELNAGLNGVVIETTSNDLLGGDAPGIEVVLAGDIFYERPTAERGMAWLRSLAARGVLVLVGDPGRIYSPRQGLEVLATYEVPTSRELEDGDSRLTTVARVLP
jgi:predicted nicotinamide N-methyase